jgi:hypothetical protein
MKNKIARFILTATGFAALAAVPAFANDLNRDYRALNRENADIRADRYRMHEDVEHGRFWRADRERRDLRHDYVERNELRRDIYRDERFRRW